MRRPDDEHGMALYTALLALLVFSALTLAMITLSLSTKKDHDASFARTQRRYLAEAGVAEAVSRMASGNSAVLGTAEDGLEVGPGSYYTTATDNGDGTTSIFSTGTMGTASRRLCAVVREGATGVFAHSMFAGNTSGDPTYVLELGGTGRQADDIDGSIYSGGDLRLSGDATVSGDLRAAGEVLGEPDDDGENGVTQPILDLASIDFPTNHDVNVKALFVEEGSPSYVPEESPAHVFRMNPTDRLTENLSTTKDDFYLEDYYEAIKSTTSTNPSSATSISLTGTAGTPGSGGNRVVYYVDGNIWVHNLSIYSFVLDHIGGGGVQVTFVARGNIYFSDNIIQRNPQKDGVAFIAIKDSGVADSGNIYFGDSRFGTLERMDAFMYAENNFYDRNLSASGSANIIVNGIMSAGNQILIDRDSTVTTTSRHGGVTTTLAHTQLVLNYDDRVVTGDLALPGVPAVETGTVGTGSVSVLSVFEVEAR